MKLYHKYLMIIFIILCFFLGNCTPKTNHRDTVIIPKENKIELDKVWEIQMDAQQAN